MNTPILQSFLEHGYVRIEPRMERAEHEDIYWSTDKVFRTIRPGFNPHNNILPMIPGLHAIFEDPAVKDGLKTILGENYLIHPHRHCHTNFPRVGAATPAMQQGLHKDGHAVRPRPRHREPRWLILFYSPQTTPPHRGPTAVLPGTHLLPELAYYTKETPLVPPIERINGQLQLPKNYFQPNVDSLHGEPGVVLCHFDIGHGAMVNGSVLPRYVHKFVVMRTERPTPSSGPRIDTENAIQSHLWRWLGYSDNRLFEPMPLKEWQASLRSRDPLTRVEAYYQSPQLAEEQPSVVRDSLLEVTSQQLKRFDQDAVLNIADAVNGLAQLSDKSPLLDMLIEQQPGHIATGCYGAGQCRLEDALPTIHTLMHHSNPVVQRHAISAAGIISGESGVSLDATLDHLDELIRNHDDWDVRLYAVQALIRLGTSERSIPTLSCAAQDSNGYVSSFAMEQLCRIDTEAARRAVIEPLRRQRWFPHWGIT